VQIWRRRQQRAGPRRPPQPQKLPPPGLGRHGAGIAAAFNAPIAAITFTLEELIGDLDQTMLSGVIVAAALAAVVEHSIPAKTRSFTLTRIRARKYILAHLVCLARPARGPYVSGAIHDGSASALASATHRAASSRARHTR